MKLGFNEATALECKGQSLMADLEMCEKYGFDYIEIRFDCVKDYLKEYTLEELADWFKNHHLKPWAYNTLIFFNQRDEAGENEQIVIRATRQQWLAVCDGDMTIVQAALAGDD